MAREQSPVVAGLEAVTQQLPLPVLGIDSDNDIAFIDEALTNYCADRGIEFPHFRVYRRNYGAWIEQKHGEVNRSFLDHERYPGQVGGNPGHTCTGPYVFT